MERTVEQAIQFANDFIELHNVEDEDIKQEIYTISLESRKNIKRTLEQKLYAYINKDDNYKKSCICCRVSKVRIMNDPFNLVVSRFNNKDIMDTLNGLPKREKMVVMLYFGINHDSMTLKEIGIEMGVSASRVLDIRNKGLRRLRQRLMHNCHYCC